MDILASIFRFFIYELFRTFAKNMNTKYLNR